MDDFTADLSTTGMVSLGAIAAGTIETPEDSDWFEVTLQAGTAYSFSVFGADHDGGTLVDPVLTLRDADGAPLASSDDAETVNTRDAALTGFVAPYSGSYYIEAGAFDANGIGTYSVEAIAGEGLSILPDFSSDDFPAGPATTGRVEVNGPVSRGVIETEGDIDWFAIDLEAGIGYTIAVFGADNQGGTLEDPVMRVRDASGQALVEVDDFNADTFDAAVVDFAVTSSGTYYVEAAGFGGDQIGTYSVEAFYTDGPPDDYPADDTTTGVLALGRLQAATFEYEDDVDWFAVELQAGQTYKIDVVPSRPSTFYDVILQAPPVGGSLQLGGGEGAFEVPETGRYYVDIYGGAVDDYEVRIREIDVPDDHGNTTETATALGTEGTASGEFEYFLDMDVFSATLEEGQSYDIEVTAGANLAAEGLLTGVSLLDADGMPLENVARDEIDGVYRLSGYVAPASGVVYVEVPQGQSELEYRYEVRVVEVAPPLTLVGTDGNDQLTGGSGNDSISGGGGEDNLLGLAGADTIDGGTGDDGVYGGAGNDVLRGGAGNDNIAGAAGSDMVDGNAGNDLIGGGTGNDTLRGGTGEDGIFAGQGDDLVRGGAGDDRLSGGIGFDEVFGGAGDDELGGGRQEDLVDGGDGNDTAGGGGGADIVLLGAGDDEGYGGAGNDYVFGGTGDDLVAGGRGNDVLDGGAGNDTLRGGFGADTFEFHDFGAGEVDVIEALDALEDVIYLDVEDASQFTVTEVADGTEIAIGDFTIRVLGATQTEVEDAIITYEVI
ncbi:calcium-binding protein [Roseivivax sediminis]|uniref:Hemolysin-type calcium-binding repeat-containing protein n=1 Tax=Roseivivax sediminis TaxID=936889 RepID=A0A1I1YPP8_9RHOB|nr:calcium-binding protein [Roseivivax sediminis]SFE21282.1 Hemolysin-type calcium-binding repeat-containing protein [Roseivivax sediminis]